MLPVWVFVREQPKLQSFFLIESGTYAGRWAAEWGLIPLLLFCCWLQITNSTAVIMEMWLHLKAGLNFAHAQQLALFHRLQRLLLVSGEGFQFRAA